MNVENATKKSFKEFSQLLVVLTLSAVVITVLFNFTLFATEFLPLAEIRCTDRNPKQIVGIIKYKNKHIKVTFT